MATKAQRIATLTTVITGFNQTAAAMNAGGAALLADGGSDLQPTVRAFNIVADALNQASPELIAAMAAARALADPIVVPPVVTPPVVATPPPSTGPIPTIQQMPVNLAALVGLIEQVAPDRYQRFQISLVIKTTALALPFRSVNVVSGGTLNPLTYPRYGLLFNGVERATATVAPGATGGTFTGALGDELDGPVLTQIVAYDGSGQRVTAPAETLLVFGVTLNRDGEAPLAENVIVQTSDFEWSHISPPVHAWAFVPKRLFVPIARPLTPRAPVPFSTMLPPARLLRLDIVPNVEPSFNQTHYPVLDADGVMTTANPQAYFVSSMSRGAAPLLPHFDGPRGVATVCFPTFLKCGRNGKIYGLDPVAFWVMDATGAKRTLAGKRHANPPVLPTYSAEQTVGNWNAAIPADERFPWESWGFDWDTRTLALDMTAPLIDGAEPHVGLGPVAYVSDRHGYILKMQFDGHNHLAPPLITRFCPAADPWGLAFNPTDNTLYFAERQAHRIAQWSVDTGQKLRDVVVDPNAVQCCLFDPPEQITHDVRLIGTLASARACATVAPETIAIQDGYLYWSSFVQQEIRRKNLATGDVTVACRPILDGNSHFLSFAISDGTFGPRGTLFTTTYSNGDLGHPQVWLPTPGTLADGTAVSHSVRVGLIGYQPNLTRGAGASASAGYAIACAVGNGMLVSGSSSFGLDVFMQADAVDVAADAARATRGSQYFHAKSYQLLWGPNGYGPTSLPLPWGENADMDYYLQQAGL